MKTYIVRIETEEIEIKAECVVETNGTLGFYEGVPQMENLIALFPVSRIVCVIEKK